MHFLHFIFRFNFSKLLHFRNVVITYENYAAGVCCTNEIHVQYKGIELDLACRCKRCVVISDVIMRSSFGKLMSFLLMLYLEESF